MIKYPLLLDILPIYSASFGYEEEFEDKLLCGRFKGDSKNTIKAEIQKLLADNDISLVKFLEVDCLEAYVADDDEDAREFIIERVWGVLFPEEII